MLLGLLRVTLLTALLVSFIAAGLTDADRSPLGSGRQSEGWKYLYNAIALSLLPRVRIFCSKFKILDVKISEFLFLYHKASCKVYKDLYHLKISHYTVSHDVDMRGMLANLCTINLR